MRLIDGRLHRLEDRLAPPDLPRRPRERLRVVVCELWLANLATSTCTRTRSAGGMLVEVVHLNGSREGLSDEDLDRFVERFPVAIMAGGRAR